MFLNMFNNFKSNNITKLWKPFLILFLISFLVVNWNEISWVFNYKVVLGLTEKFFQREEVAVPQVSPKESKNSEPLQKSGLLEIAKLGITAPLVFVDETSQAQSALAKGVVHWPKSVLPGEKGRTFVLGHSAPPNWPKIRYEWVFSRISELKIGDEILITFNNKKYSYRVTKQIFLERGEEIPVNLEDEKSFIYLITCWPPGKDIRRLAVEAQLD